VAVVNGSARLTSLMQQRVAASTDAGDAADGWLALQGVPASVPVARDMAISALEGCPRADDLVLALSELATNAVVHSASGEGGMFLVRVRMVTLWARIEVWDGGPASGPAGHGLGYGLRLVREITDRSGVTFRECRRLAWAECTWTL
jgi:serine/threonine-protein kinase RsbW